jgi:hypothetical protein
VATGSSGSDGYATKPTQDRPVNPAAVPLGDGYVSTSPRIGYVDSCQMTFGGGGATMNGPWIDGTHHTWDYFVKKHVNGAIRWPSAAYKVTVRGGRRVITFNDLPVKQVTGVFPIQRSDPAYRYDQNGNHIAAQSITWSLPLNPVPAKTPGCLGARVGVLADGVVLFDALDGEGRDAAAHELLDVCAGHPDMTSTYHHHDIPPCILDKVPKGTSRLVGFALDGYGIYVVKDRQGRLPNNAALDACHGTSSRVRWNGKLRRIYHYVATLEYPYSVGCYRGSPIAAARGPAGGPPGAGGPGGRQGLVAP